MNPYGMNDTSLKIYNAAAAMDPNMCGTDEGVLTLWGPDYNALLNLPVECHDWADMLIDYRAGMWIECYYEDENGEKKYAVAGDELSDVLTLDDIAKILIDVEGTPDGKVLTSREDLEAYFDGWKMD